MIPGFIVRGGMLYYHQAGSAIVVRYNLENASKEMDKEISGFAYRDCPQTRGVVSFLPCNETDRDSYLYGIDHNFADFAADEHGIWLILHYKNEHILSVVKLDELTLNTIKSWRIRGALINETGNAFVMCGILYTIQDATARRSRINYAYDLFENTEYKLNIPWINPKEQTTMIDYNPLDSRIYFFDSGRLFSSPVGALSTVPSEWKRIR